jgi:hypothetical protein
MDFSFIVTPDVAQRRMMRRPGKPLLHNPGPPHAPTAAPP